MIEEKDIKIYLKAKRQQLVVNILQALSTITLFMMLGSALMGLGDFYTIILAVCSATFMGAAFGGGRLVSVPREELINLIGKMINSDPEALVKLAAVKDSYLRKNT